MNIEISREDFVCILTVLRMMAKEQGLSIDRQRQLEETRDHLMEFETEEV